MVLIQEGFERGSPRAFQRWSAVLARMSWWRWRVESGVQAQSGDQSDRFAQGLAAVEQVEDGVAVVPHQYQGTVGQPAAQQHDHLPRPVGDLLVPVSLTLVVARRGRQHREHWESPVASGPGHLAQPHQGDPAQAAGLDQLVATGADRVPVDASGSDLGAATAFQGFVDAEDQRTVAAIQVLKQEQQQDAGGLTGRPHCPVEHFVVAGVVALAAATHDTERHGHGALSWGQDRAHQQHLSLPPGWIGEQRCEGKKNGYNGSGQGEHGWAFSDVWVRPAYPVLLLL